MGAVHHLRPSTVAIDDDGGKVNVVRLVEYLGPVSPELALVDPELAARARALLPDTPGIRVPRRERDEPIPLRVADVPASSRPSWRIATLAALAAAASASFGLGVSAAVSGESEVSATFVLPTTTTPASTVQAGNAPDLTHPAEIKPAKNKSKKNQALTKAQPAKPQRSSKPRAAPAKPVAPRFVWAPQKDADRYRFALYRGDQLIFERDVASPALELPRAWTFRGRFYDLGKGRYRWVVWPYVGAGERLGSAIVSATYSG